MNEFTPKYVVEKDDFFRSFTFLELSQQNITSQQLYLWSAPIDLIEHYQFYLNQRSTSNDLSLGEKEVFYNCTMPRFGPMCQYELVSHRKDPSSLNEIIEDFYHNYEYDATTTFTCYTHLQCYRGPTPACLQWMEVCDGKIDCLDGGLDEADCWQLEMNQCQDDEFRCRNGQCIPKSFYQDAGGIADCADISDEPSSSMIPARFCRYNDVPSFACEDLLAEDEVEFNAYLRKNTELLMKTMYSSPNSAVSQECLSALKCLLNFIHSEYSSCEVFCNYDECIEIVQNSCPEMFYFPNVPVLFGDIYFVYRKNDFQNANTFSTVPFYVCYDKSRYDEFFVNAEKLFFNNMTCIDSEPFIPFGDLSSFSLEVLHMRSIKTLYQLLNRYHLMFNYTSEICNRSSMYQCLHSSKCISISRLLDGVYDCPYIDDENTTLISTPDVIKQLDKTHYKCQTSGKYIPQSFLQNGRCDCLKSSVNWCEDEDEQITYLKTNIVFQHICDGFVDQLPVLITDRNETDETGCEQWECNNTYTRCNNVWNCLNGADEAGCISTSTLNCSSKEHLCVSPVTDQFVCLPIEKANDGNIDCLGATDEPQLCGTRTQLKGYNIKYDSDFYCMNQSSQSCISYSLVCDKYDDCKYGDDEQFCKNRTHRPTCGICSNINSPCNDIERFFCKYRVPSRVWTIIYFKHDGMIKLNENQAKHIESTMLSSSPAIRITQKDQSRCHWGLDLRVWLNNHNHSTRNICLCPRSFYGDQCQYQNQRITLTIKFRALASSWQTLFAVVISLIDDSDQRIIHSYEQLTFLSVRDCQTKFNMYLLYSTRPKNPSRHYFIHIDIYEKVSLTYRGSLFFPVTFSVLPVYRLSLIVDLPRTNDQTRSCSSNQCVHGQCIRYANSPQNLTFCQCHQGWSGRYCSNPHTCYCSLDSLCIGVSANNRSICVCPLHKFGPRCLLFDTTCQTDDNSTCEHGGQCISNDNDIVSNRKFTCVCRQGFSGDRCEKADNNITLSFGKDILLSESIFIHFIEVIDIYHVPVRSTTFRTILVKQDSVIIHWARPFHLIFIELFNRNYYLAVVQKIYNQSAFISKVINPSDRCSHISEVMNETIVQWHLLRRIKYYHLPCQTYSPDLQCFYDEVHLCLCYNFGETRLANCLKFQHNMTFDCSGRSECENGGRCFQDKPDCPERSICICPTCFYGRRCQFSTSGFVLSLDAILNYHILPCLRLTEQPVITQVSFALTIIFFVVGLINSLLSLITFKNKTVCEVGCGLYLLCSSITTLLITMLFGLKFLILLLAQMAIISNRSFLSFQCHTMDFILRVCLCMDQWLNACVASERAFTAIKGTRFVKKKSKQAAKFVITILFLIVLGSCIHDPLYRHLIDEENDDDDDDLRRTWCIVKYGRSLEIYNSAMHIFHFLGPFTINLISIIILIRKKSLQQLIIHPQQTYRQHLHQQYHEHKHLLTAPIVFVILAVPRLVLSFLSKCMQSANDVWLFLIGYFLSFIPPMLTFVVFILSSRFYRKEFDKSFQQFRRMIQQRLRIIS